MLAVTSQFPVFVIALAYRASFSVRFLVSRLVSAQIATLTHPYLMGSRRVHEWPSIQQFHRVASFLPGQAYVFQASFGVKWIADFFFFILIFVQYYYFQFLLGEARETGLTKTGRGRSTHGEFVCWKGRGSYSCG